MKKILIFAALAVLLVGLPLISKFTGGSDTKQVETQKVELAEFKRHLAGASAEHTRLEALQRDKLDLTERLKSSKTELKEALGMRREATP